MKNTTTPLKVIGSTWAAYFTELLGGKPRLNLGEAGKNNIEKRTEAKPKVRRYYSKSKYRNQRHPHSSCHCHCCSCDNYCSRCGRRLRY